MKRIILILALIVGTTSFAQQEVEKKSSNAEQRTVSNDRNIERITAELDLSDSQQDKLKEILKKRDELRKSKPGREEAKSQNEALEKEFRAILTPEQAKKFDQMKEKRKAKTLKRQQKLKSSKALEKRSVKKRKRIEPKTKEK